MQRTKRVVTVVVLALLCALLFTSVHLYAITPAVVCKVSYARPEVNICAFRFY